MFRVFLVSIFVLSIPACSPFRETEQVHIVHSGEAAVLAHHADGSVYASVDKSNVHALARAIESQNERAVEEMVSRGQVLKLPANTHVQVLRESFNERFVRIEDGDSAGKSAWVPYEWLRAVPVKPAQHGG